jgi:hypothetical protein
MGSLISLKAEDGHEFDCYKADPSGTPKGGIVAAILCMDEPAAS